MANPSPPAPPYAFSYNIAATASAIAASVAVTASIGASASTNAAPAASPASVTSHIPFSVATTHLAFALAAATNIAYGSAGQRSLAFPPPPCKNTA